MKIMRVDDNVNRINSTLTHNGGRSSLKHGRHDTGVHNNHSTIQKKWDFPTDQGWDEYKKDNASIVCSKFSKYLNLVANEIHCEMFKQVKDTLGNVYPFKWNTRKGNYIMYNTMFLTLRPSCWTGKVFSKMNYKRGRKMERINIWILWNCTEILKRNE